MLARAVPELGYGEQLAMVRPDGFEPPTLRV